MKSKKSIKIIVIILISIFVLAGIVLGIILGIKFFSKKCDPLTPLALKKFEIAAGIKPVSGDKCEISKNSYLLRLIYDDDDSAETAKTGLQLATPGERDEIGGLDWITKDGDSSVFWTNDEKLGILVVPGEDDEKTIDKQINKAYKKLK
jgi:uncharacterized protein YneF (UPF0154 family)